MGRCHRHRIICDCFTLLAALLHFVWKLFGGPFTHGLGATFGSFGLLLMPISSQLHSIAFKAIEHPAQSGVGRARFGNRLTLPAQLARCFGDLPCQLRDVRANATQVLSRFRSNRTGDAFLQLVSGAQQLIVLWDRAWVS